MQSRLTSIGDDYLIHPRTIAEDPLSGDLNRAADDCRTILRNLEATRKGLDNVVILKDTKVELTSRKQAS